MSSTGATSPIPTPLARLPIPNGIAALMIHALVSLTVATFAFVLAMTGRMDKSMAFGLFGTIVGAHVTAAASVQVHRRRTDPLPPGQ